MFTYLILEISAWMIGAVTAFYIVLHLMPHHIKAKKHLHTFRIPIVVLIIALTLGIYSNETYAPDFAMPAFMHTYSPGNASASLPYINIVKFFTNASKFERVSDIGADPNMVPAPITRKENELVKIHLDVKEVISEIAPGIYSNYWTYDGKVPGPMLRIKEGDTVELSITNDKTSLHAHNIDLHAVTGPGGGASVTMVQPGETKAFRFKALNQGLYVYHCAAMNASMHNAHGQYGLILVEPKEGLPKVDKEFYLMQGELYTAGGLGRKGLTRFDTEAFLDGTPNYVTFNGRVESTPRMEVKTGDHVRIFVGNGGVNLISSFHVIGEIFDKVYPEGAMGEGSAIFKNVQTTAVLPGGSSIVEFTAEVPGKLVAVDHALSRMNKGAWAVINVVGPANPEVFEALTHAAPEKQMEGGMKMQGGY